MSKDVAEDNLMASTRLLSNIILSQLKIIFIIIEKDKTSRHNYVVKVSLSLYIFTQQKKLFFRKRINLFKIEGMIKMATG